MPDPTAPRPDVPARGVHVVPGEVPEGQVPPSASMHTPEQATRLRDTIADAITMHPGNRTGTPEQRHPVSLMLAGAIIPAVQATLPAAPWTGVCVECNESIEDGDLITWRLRYAPQGPIHEECR
ncbi:hypothetical protein GCM10022254_09450 [Actinomadura meridiana]|uniref:Uncharacterized protein n=1 Tax=Actinomadura meridiana TaxID=559626 RepID=A0ABP8BTR4_9ACTN